MALVHALGILLVLLGRQADPKKPINGLRLAAEVEAEVAVNCLRAGDPHAAMSRANQALLWSADQATARAVLAYCLAQEDDLEHASAEAQKALKLAPDLSYAHTARALCLFKTQRADEAKAECAEAVKEWPNDPLAYLLQGNLEAENSPEAEKAYLKAIQADPKVAEPHAALAAIYAAKNAYLAAEGELVIATTLLPKVRNWQLQLAEVELHTGKAVGALDHFSKALALLDPAVDTTYPTYLRIQLGRLSAYETLAMYPEAEAVGKETFAYKDAHSTLPFSPVPEGQIHNQLGNVYYDHHQWEDAINEYEAARGLNVVSPVYALNEAYAELSLDRLDKAAELATGVQANSPNSPEIYDILGSVAYAQDQWAVAATNYKQAVDLSPETAVYHAKLATAYANQKQFGPADVECRRAFELAPKSPNCFNALGILFFEKSDFSAGLPLFQIASSLSPESSVIHANLAGCYLKLKQTDKAREEGQKAYDLGLRHHWALKELGLLPS